VREELRKRKECFENVSAGIHATDLARSPPQVSFQSRRKRLTSLGGGTFDKLSRIFG